ncbi:MAG TPA: hypothetical protein VMV88_03150 [Gallionella sp.]|nr:hypothetical protein [Gallionella sp.]
MTNSAFWIHGCHLTSQAHEILPTPLDQQAAKLSFLDPILSAWEIRFVSQQPISKQCYLIHGIEFAYQPDVNRREDVGFDLLAWSYLS